MILGLGKFGDLGDWGESGISAVPFGLGVQGNLSRVKQGVCGEPDVNLFTGTQMSSTEGVSRKARFILPTLSKECGAANGRPPLSASLGAQRTSHPVWPRPAAG